MRTAGIIGGGIGGLTSAIALHQAGWHVEVFERAAHPDRAGTALGMWPTALQALDTLGLGAQVRKLGAPQHGGSFLRPDGNRIATINVSAIRGRTGDSVYLLSRPALLRLLHGALPEGVVRFSTEVTDLASARGAYDVVLVADGVFSRNRAALFGTGSRPRYAGATAWRGTVDGAVDTVTETWGPGQRFGITPREDGRTNWYATLVGPEGMTFSDGDVAALETRFAGWHDGVRRVLDLVREEETLRHDLYDLDPPLPTYVQDNAALLGDAAHAMTPDLGRGACEALLDSVTVARCLVDAPSVADGLTAYDRGRRKPTQRLVRMSRTAGRLAQARRLAPVRDLAVRTALAFGPPG